MRVDDRVRPTHLAQPQALAVRRHGPALDRRGDARSQAAVPQADRLLRPSPSSPSPSNAISSPKTSRRRPPTSRYARHCLTVTPGPSPRSSTTIETHHRDRRHPARGIHGPRSAANSLGRPHIGHRISSWRPTKPYWRVPGRTARRRTSTNKLQPVLQGSEFARDKMTESSGLVRPSTGLGRLVNS